MQKGQFELKLTISLTTAMEWVQPENHVTSPDELYYIYVSFTFVGKRNIEKNRIRKWF